MGSFMRSLLRLARAVGKAGPIFSPARPSHGMQQIHRYMETVKQLYSEVQDLHISDFQDFRAILGTTLDPTTPAGQEEMLAREASLSPDEEAFVRQRYAALFRRTSQRFDSMIAEVDQMQVPDQVRAEHKLLRASFVDLRDSYRCIERAHRADSEAAGQEGLRLQAESEMKGDQFSDAMDQIIDLLCKQ